MPSVADVLRMRVRTTGVITQPLTIKGKNFQVIDVGGQRSERKKWFNQFSSVTAVIFVTAISEFDQKLYEDDHTNRLKESIDLFDTTINNPVRVGRLSSSRNLLCFRDLFPASPYAHSFSNAPSFCTSYHRHRHRVLSRSHPHPTTTRTSRIPPLSSF